MKEYLESGMSKTDVANMFDMHRHTVTALSKREKNHVQPTRNNRGAKLDLYQKLLSKRVQDDKVLNYEKPSVSFRVKAKMEEKRY